MGKLDQLRQLGAANVAESTGARGAGLPPGLDPSKAAGMPAHQPIAGVDRVQTRAGGHR